MTRRRVATLLVVLGGPACFDPLPPDEARAKADKIWSDRCTTCHGPMGDGDGPQARLLDTKPRRLRDPDWQATVTDAHLHKVIVEGGQAVDKSPLMAPNPDLADKPEVVRALIARIRALR